MTQNAQIPYFQDISQLTQLTSPKIYRLGLHDYNENCVTECYLQNNILVAHVEDEQEELPVQVNCYLTPEHQLQVSCDCGQEDEYVCRHAIAGLLYFANETEEQENTSFSTARENAIKERQKRGRTEVEVELFAGSQPQLWKARSINSATHRPQEYQVQIRSLTEAQNHCTCPDWINNQLGTCKHIEAVLHHISNRQRDFKPQPLSYIYRAWEQQEPVLKLHKAESIADSLQELLAHYFDASGAFTGELPLDFYRLKEQANHRADLQLGEDAHQLVEGLVKRQSDAIKADQIRKQIEDSAGKIPGVNATLYSYQVDGVAFLASKGRAILADDMGLGKTLQSISAAMWMHRHQQVEKVLIICPASLKHQWAREIEKFTGLSCQIIQGNPEQRVQQYKRQPLFMIANYESMLADLDHVNELVRPDLVILDEAQRLKNWQTKIASTIKLIQSPYAFVLSGTPLENRLEDLYSLMQIVDGQILGPLWRYMTDYHLLSEKGKVIGYRNLVQLRKRIAPVMLRRNRNIVSSQLPSRTVTQIDVTMTSKQRGYHSSAMSAASQLSNIATKRPLTPSERNRLMSSLQQARMACCAAGLIDKETKTSPKLNELRELLTTLCLEQGEKVVIFSQWKTMTELTENLLNEMGINSVHLHGGVPTAKRGDLMERFRNDDSIGVFLSTDAGGTGLNLQCASVLVNLDVPWNPAVLEQRNARVHRLGQKQQVQIILMVAADSYEERVLELVQNKQNLFDNVVSPDASEDVVGVSKKGFEAILEDLKKQDGQTGALAEDEPAPEPEIDTADAAETTEKPEQIVPIVRGSDEDPELTRLVIELQSHFAHRLSEVLSHNGSLLLVLDTLTEADEVYLDQQEGPLPVAAIDQRSLKQLTRLGGLSPLANSQPVMTTSVANHRQRWLDYAGEQLADVSQQVVACQSGALKQVEAVLCAMISAIANQPECFNQQQALLWLYGEEAKEQSVSSEQRSSFTKLFSLSQLEQAPQPLALQVLTEVDGLLTAYS